MKLSIPFTKYGHLKMGRGKSSVKLLYVNTMNTLLVYLYGGKAHVGACTASLNFSPLKQCKTLKFAKHHDDVVTKKVTRVMQKKFSGPLAVFAGIHYDQITKKQIESIVNNSEKLANKLLLTVADHKRN
jgi:gallate decarboxylase subunit D